MIWTVLTLFSVLSPGACFSSLCPNCTGLPLRDLPGLSMLHPATGPLNMLLSWLGMHLLHFVWSAHTYHSHPNLFFFKKDIYDFLDLSVLRSLHCPIPLCVSLLCLSHGCVAGEGGSSQLARTVAGWKVLSSGWGGKLLLFLCVLTRCLWEGIPSALGSTRLLLLLMIQPHFVLTVPWLCSILFQLDAYSAG